MITIALIPAAISVGEFLLTPIDETLNGETMRTLFVMWDFWRRPG
jgi:hypothetical protein